MANVAISALPAALTTTSADLVPIVQSATTKKLTMDLLYQYIAAQINSLSAQIPCDYATTLPLTATYSNGTAGVGATLSGSGTFTVDGFTPVVTDRVLIKDQASAVQNGAYTVTSVGASWVLTRATDYDESAEIAPGDSFVINYGTTLANTLWVQDTNDPIVIGTDGITFSQLMSSSFARPLVAAMVFGGQN